MHKSEWDWDHEELDRILVFLFRRWRDVVAQTFSKEEMKRLDLLYLFCDGVRWGLLEQARKQGLEIGPVGGAMDELLEERAARVVERLGHGVSARYLKRHRCVE